MNCTKTSRQIKKKLKKVRLNQAEKITNKLTAIIIYTDCNSYSQVNRTRKTDELYMH